MTDLYKNFAYCKLTADVDDVTTSFSVDETSRLPSALDLANPGFTFLMTVESTLTAGEFEIVQVVNKSTASGAGTLTVVRAQDNSTAVAHTSGTFLKAALTAQMTQNLRDYTDNAKLINNLTDWNSGNSYKYGDSVRFRGGVYGASTDIPTWAGDPLTPSDLQLDNTWFSFGNGAGPTLASLGAATDRAAQGFQLQVDTPCYGILVEGQVGFPVGAQVTVGIATSLGSGTPTFVTSVVATVPPDAANYDTTAFSVPFPSPVTLTASTQYWVVLIGVGGDTSVVGNWLYQDASQMSIGTYAPGVITDSMYDCFYDATFSTNLNATAGATARFWTLLANTIVNDWHELIAPPATIYDTTMPTPDASLRGRLGILQQSGIEDILQICLRNSDGTSYGWFEIVRGDAIIDLSTLSHGLATCSGGLTVASSTPPSYVQSSSASAIYNQYVTTSMGPRTPGHLLVAYRPQQYHDFPLPDPSGWTVAASYNHPGGYMNAKVYTRVADNTGGDDFPLNNSSSSIGLAAVVYEFANAAFGSASFADNHLASTSGTLNTPGTTASSGDIVLSACASITGGNGFVSADAALSHVEWALGNGQTGASGGMETISGSGTSAARTMAWNDAAGGIDVVTASIRIIPG